MAGERTLFERLLAPEARTPRTSRQRKDMMVESVISHLRSLLNTRQGSCETLEDYGMPELEGKTGARNLLASEMEAEIRNTIGRYEPRLRRVQVRYEALDEEFLMPRFVVTAQLTSRDDFPKDVSFSTVVDPIGKVRVE